MRRYALAALAAFVLVLFVWWLPTGERFELPEGYAGPVVIFFKHPAGTSPARDWLTKIYRIPSSGMLLVKDDIPDRAVVEWYYLSKDGKHRTPVRWDDEESPNTTSTEPHIRHFQTHTQGEFQWIEASVGRPADPDSFGEKPHYVVDRIKDGMNFEGRKEMKLPVPEPGTKGYRVFGFRRSAGLSAETLPAS
jgi:hypothetical protein